MRRVTGAQGHGDTAVFIALERLAIYEEALTPEESLHTSAYDRIRGRQERHAQEQKPAARSSRGMQQESPDGWLCPLTLDERAEAYRGADPSASGLRASDKGLLPIKLEQYLELLDWTGRELASGKRGSIPQHFAPILDRLGINRGMWLELVTQFDRLFGHVVGRAEQVVERASQAGRRWYRGRGNCAEAFG